jgi:GSH-dependent disulfide-bond oxidoreductase
MIELYTWITANCQKVNIAVEELGVAYELRPINIGKREQFAPDFLRISPNNKVPAIVDRDIGIQMMESGAILLYLAEKAGRLLPPEPESHWKVVEWIMWQMGGVGPAFAQLNHYRSQPDKAPYALERFEKEARRLLKVLEGRLEGRDYVAGSYSVADIAIWPWISRYERLGFDLLSLPNVLAWYRRIAERPAVQRGFQILQPDRQIPLPDGQA